MPPLHHGCRPVLLSPTLAPVLAALLRTFAPMVLLGVLAGCGDPQSLAELEPRTEDASGGLTPTRLERVEADGAGSATRRPTDVDRVPPGHVAVTVLDAAGRPVEGVRVAGVQVDAEGRPTGRPKLRLGATTDAAGRALVGPRRQGPLYAAGLFGRSLAYSTADAPHTIVLPPVGALAVDVSAFGDPLTITVRDRDDRSSRELRRRDAPSVVTIGLVPLGRSFSCDVVGDDFRCAEVVVGPAVDGETVTWRPGAPVFVELRARILGPDGAPLEGQDVDVSGTGAVSGDLRFEPDGRAPGTVAARIEAERWHGASEASLVFAVRAESGSGVHAPVELERPALVEDPSVVDLGDVRVHLLPILCAGRVVDADGRAVPEARVGVCPRYPKVEIPDELPVTETGDEGTFVLRSASMEASDVRNYIVEARLGRRGPKALRPLRWDERDVVLALEAPGRVAVDVSGLPPQVREGLALELTDERGVGALAAEGVTRWRGDEREVPTGTYSLSVTLGYTRTHVIPGVVVEPGRLCADARLSPLDVEVRRALVVDERGQPRLDVHVSYGGDPGRLSVMGVHAIHSGEGGWVEWVVPSEGVEARIGYSARALLSLAEVETGDTVVLPRALAGLDVIATEVSGPAARFRLTPADDATRARWGNVDVLAACNGDRLSARGLPDGRFALEVVRRFGREERVLLQREVDLRAGETLVVRAP